LRKEDLLRRQLIARLEEIETLENLACVKGCDPWGGDQ